MRYTMNKKRTKLFIMPDDADRPRVKLDVIASFECEENDRFYVIVTDWTKAEDGGYVLTAGSFASTACEGEFRPAMPDELAMVNEVVKSIMEHIGQSARLSTITPGEATKTDLDELARTIERELGGR